MKIEIRRVEPATTRRCSKSTRSRRRSGARCSYRFLRRSSASWSGWRCTTSGSRAASAGADEGLVDLADNRLKRERLELTVYTDNEPALRLYKKLGFEIEGTHRKHAFRDGAYVDSYCMARVR